MKYETFIKRVLERLDEEDVGIEDLWEQAEHFRAVRACFLAGEPIEDEDLNNFVLTFYKEARTKSDVLLREVDKSLDMITRFLEEKAAARRCRLRGNVDAALNHEVVAEWLYSNLPTRWKW